jgi:hypothetical protein
VGLVLKVNGTVIPSPSSFQPTHYKITKSTRLSNGSMSMELIAKKKKFVLKYDVITSAELSSILNLADTNSMFFTFEHNDRGSIETNTCYCGDVPYELIAAGEYFKNFQIDFIEQ